jgi:hypothetical protein
MKMRLRCSASTSSPIDVQTSVYIASTPLTASAASLNRFTSAPSRATRWAPSITASGSS